MARYVVTGTRQLYLGSKFQIAHILEMYADALAEITFGGALGVDTEAALCVAGWDRRPFMRLVLPANRTQCDARNIEIDWDEVIEMPDGSSYMDRNEKMLDNGERVIAFPRGGREKLRSGTWATVRRAEKRGYEVNLHPLDGGNLIWRLKR